MNCPKCGASMHLDGPGIGDFVTGATERAVCPKCGAVESAATLHLRINSIYLYAMLDDNDNEGVPTMMYARGLIAPMLGFDDVRAEQLRDHALRVVKQSGRAVKLLKFSVREEVEVFEP